MCVYHVQGQHGMFKDPISVVAEFAYVQARGLVVACTVLTKL